MSSWTNGSLREIFCLITLLSTTCLFSTYLHSTDISFRNYGNDDHLDVLVSWRPSFDDPDVYVLDNEIRQTLLFNPTAFTGSEFFAKTIREMILLDTTTDVKVYDFVGAQREPMPLDYQSRILKGVLGTQNLESSSTFILSDVHISDLYQGMFQPSRTISVSFLRNPLDSFVSAFYYRRYGEPLFGRSAQNQSQKEYLNLLAKATHEVEEYVRHNQDVRPFANEITATVQFCGGNVSRCHGVHPGRAGWVFSRAKNSASDDRYFIGVLEDYRYIPRLLEIISPLVCGGLTNYFHGRVRWPPWMGAKVNLSQTTIATLRQDNRMKLELRFYEWARQRYHQQKKRILAENKFN